MNICTIVDENWLDTHLKWFMHKALRAMPKRYVNESMGVDVELNRYYLVVVHRSDKEKLAQHPVVRQFDYVQYVEHDPDKPGYLQYNALRFSLLERFGIDQVLYTDADVNILGDLRGIKTSTADLMWVKSPCEIAGMKALLELVGLPGDHIEGTPHHNAGLLYMRRDFHDEYLEAAQKAIDAEFTPRMIGNAAFNIMIRSLPLEDHCEAPYKYDTIWWDHAKLNEALAVHYCNDDGKRKREFLESVWVSP